MSEAANPAPGGPEGSTIDPPEHNVTLLKTEKLPNRIVHWTSVPLPIDILLLTVKECEFLGCLSHLNPDFSKSYFKSLGDVYFGEMGKDEMKLKIAVIQCNMGSNVPKGSVVVVPNAVKFLGPKAVFCVGFCGGLNHEKVKLGDVVVSARLITYASIKNTESGIRQRGVNVPLKSHLADLIRSAGYGWKAPLKDPGKLKVKVHRDGVFLSGPEVVDNNERRGELLRRFSEAIAIEMEGEGKAFTLLQNVFYNDLLRTLLIRPSRLAVQVCRILTTPINLHSLLCNACSM